MTGFKKVVLATVMLGASLGSARADIYSNTFAVTVTESVTNGQSFNSQPPAPSCNASNVACAAFTYSGALNFQNRTAQNGPGATGDLNSAFGFSATNISGYTGSGTVSYAGTRIANFGTGVGSFLASSGSASGFTYGSLYSFDLGQLAAGTILTINHDDGVSLSPDKSFVGNLTLGATSEIKEQVTITNAADYTLYFSRQNGTPSVLQVSVPEPASLSVLGASLIGMGLIRRRSRKA